MNTSVCWIRCATVDTEAWFTCHSKCSSIKHIKHGKQITQDRIKLRNFKNWWQRLKAVVLQQNWEKLVFSSPAGSCRNCLRSFFEYFINFIFWVLHQFSLFSDMMINGRVCPWLSEDMQNRVRACLFTDNTVSLLFEQKSTWQKVEESGCDWPKILRDEPQSRSIYAVSLPGGRWAVGKHLRSARSELNYVMTLPKPLQHRELKHVMALPKSLLSGNICAVNKTTSCHCLNLCSATQTSLESRSLKIAHVCVRSSENTSLNLNLRTA